MVDNSEVRNCRINGAEDAEMRGGGASLIKNPLHQVEKRQTSFQLPGGRKFVAKSCTIEQILTSPLALVEFVTLK